jgi:hypothetical protein
LFWLVGALRLATGKTIACRLNSRKPFFKYLSFYFRPADFISEPLGMRLSGGDANLFEPSRVLGFEAHGYNGQRDSSRLSACAWSRAAAWFFRGHDGMASSS